MKILFIIATCLVLWSCKSKKQAEQNQPVPLDDKVTETTTVQPSNTIIGSWKILELRDANNMLTAADNQNEMKAATIEITPQGKYITHSPGNPDVVSTYIYYDNTRQMNITNTAGQTLSHKVRFDGNQLNLSNNEGSFLLERIK